MFIETNENPLKRSVGDCVIRAISTAEDRDWDDVFLDLMVKCFTDKDITSSNIAWSSYLQERGYKRHIIPDTCPNCYTIQTFTQDHPYGTYILATGSHVVAVKHGDYYDTFDSGLETPIFYFEKERDQ